jgi:hypothetical protein
MDDDLLNALAQLTFSIRELANVALIAVVHPERMTPSVMSAIGEINWNANYLFRSLMDANAKRAAE